MSFSNTKLPKQGARVAAIRRNGLRVIGKVAGIEQRANGTFVAVNVAAPRAPMELIKFRPSQLASA